MDGPGAADVHATIPAGAADFTFVGRKANAETYVWKVPRDLENQKLMVLVKSDAGTWKYTVFTDRDVVVHYPPLGRPEIGIGGVEAVLPPPPPKPAAPAAPPPAADKARANPPGEAPSASVSPD